MEVATALSHGVDGRIKGHFLPHKVLWTVPPRIVSLVNRVLLRMFYTPGIVSRRR